MQRMPQLEDNPKIRAMSRILETMQWICLALIVLAVTVAFFSGDFKRTKSREQDKDEDIPP